MANLLGQATNAVDGDHAARIIQAALGIVSDDALNYCGFRILAHRQAAGWHA